jgi:hypothetical protein
MTRPGSKVKFDPVTGAINVGMTFEEFKKACPEIAKHMVKLPDQSRKTYKASEIKPWKPIPMDEGAYDVVGRAEEVSALYNEELAAELPQWEAEEMGNKKLDEARERMKAAHVKFKAATERVEAEVAMLDDEQVSTELDGWLKRPDVQVHLCGVKDPANPMSPNDKRSLLVEIRSLADEGVKDAMSAVKRR